MIPPPYNYQNKLASTATEITCLSKADLRALTSLALTSVNELMVKESLVQVES